MTETMTLKMGAFQTLSEEEMLVVDGGDVGTALGATAATVMIAFAAPVGLVAGSVWAAGALVLSGVGLLGKVTGLY